MGWGTWLTYFTAGWLSLAFLAYGLALNQYGGELRKAPGLVAADEVASRWAWGFGVLGDTCFRLKNNHIGWFCVSQSHLVPDNGHPGNLFFQLAPGTPLKLKAHAGKVTELTVFPDEPQRRKTLVVYGYAIGKIQDEMRNGVSGMGFILLGLLMMPLFWAVKRGYERRYRRT